MMWLYIAGGIGVAIIALVVYSALYVAGKADEIMEDGKVLYDPEEK